MSDIELQQPILVHDNKQGQEVPESVVKLDFKGRQGLKMIKSLQDCIYTIIMQLGKDSSGTSDDAPTEMTTDLLLASIEVAGKSELVFDAICSKLDKIATVAGKPLKENLQDQIALDDFEAVCNGVLTDFLLPSIIQKLNNMNK